MLNPIVRWSGRVLRAFENKSISWTDCGFIEYMRTNYTQRVCMNWEWHTLRLYTVINYYYVHYKVAHLFDPILQKRKQDECLVFGCTYKTRP